MALTLDIKKDLRYIQGEEKGAEQRTIEIAAEMLQSGLDKKRIAEITSLSIAKIEKPEKDLKKKKGDK